jgi:hypothetical protein
VSTRPRALLTLLLGLAPVGGAAAQGQVVDIRQSESIGVVVVDARATDEPPAEAVMRQVRDELRLLAPTTVSATVVNASLCDGAVACTLGRALGAFRSREVRSRALVLVSLSSGKGDLPRLSMHWYAARVIAPLLEGLDGRGPRAIELDARIEREHLRLASSTFHPLEPSVVWATRQAWRETYPEVNATLEFSRASAIEFDLPVPGFDVGVAGRLVRADGLRLTIEGLIRGPAQQVTVEHPEYEPLVLDVPLTSTVVYLAPRPARRGVGAPARIGLPSVVSAVALGGLAAAGFVIAHDRAAGLEGYCVGDGCASFAWPRVAPGFASAGSGPLALPFGFSAAAGAVVALATDLLLGDDEAWWLAPAVGLATALVVYGTSEAVAAVAGLSP